MNQRIKFILLFSILFLLNGCSSSCSGTNETNSNEQTNVIVPKRTDNASINANANTNAVIVNPQNSNANNPTLDNSNVKKIDTTSGNIPTQKQPLPENSELSVGNGKDGSFVETRKFNDDPDLDKLERILTGPKDIKIKIYFKNGKIIETDETKIKNYRTDSVSTILEAIGMKRDPKNQTNVKTKEEELKKKQIVPPAIPKKN